MKGQGELGQEIQLIHDREKNTLEGLCLRLYQGDTKKEMTTLLMCLVWGVCLVCMVCVCVWVLVCAGLKVCVVLLVAWVLRGPPIL